MPDSRCNYERNQGIYRSYSWRLGGLCGLNGERGTISNCYFLDTAGPDNGIGTPLTDSQMKQQASFVGWDFAGASANGTNSFWIIEPDTVYLFSE